MKLIVISSPDPVTEEASRINQLFGAGLEYFHLRKPEWQATQTRQLLLQIAPEHYAKIALHQHHDLAPEFGMKRLHFPEKNRRLLTEKTSEALLKQGYKLSTSVHNLEELRQLPSCFGYTFYGPVFNSISKAGYAGAVPENFLLAEAEKAVPVVALGGIDAGNIRLLRKMNFDGAALLGSIWQEPEKAAENFKQINEQCRQTAFTY